MDSELKVLNKSTFLVTCCGQARTELPWYTVYSVQRITRAVGTMGHPLLI
jgi:hypothetical protein